MLPNHKPFGGDPCKICGHPESAHPKAAISISVGDAAFSRKKARDKYNKSEKGKANRKENKKKYRQSEAGKNSNKRYAQSRSDDGNSLHIGVDGEGQGKGDHVYIYLGASTNDGERTWSVESNTWRNSWDAKKKSYGYVKPIPSEAFLEFLIGLPSQSKCFSYAFNYDLTKGLTDLPDKKLWYFFRPETRKGLIAPRPIRWKHFRLNLQGTKFSVSSLGSKRVVWDIFKFYGSKFVNALKDWKVGDQALYDRMTIMKDKRGEFDKESPEEVEKYCLEECRCMAELAKKLVIAHKDGLDIKLTTFHGAGSSAAGLLKKMGIKDQIVQQPPEMDRAVAMAFFGGRFENSVIGPVKDRIWSYDISSAYPYQLYFLPCLVHGKWRYTKSRSEMINAPTALVRYGLKPISSRTNPHWAPFPFRTSEGSICFPATSGGGWVYKDEYLAGERLFSQVFFKDAWVYDRGCDCRPFEKIGSYYLYRIKLGKEGPGITIKLAVNSCYGKLAQSVGNAVFNSWLWAGLITSGCRAQLLTLMGAHNDLGNCLMVATDGIASRERLVCPPPLFTGTGILLDGKPNNKPLGGWEEKEDRSKNPRGIFLARPGIYFPLKPTSEDIKEIKGRGVGKGVILENWKKIGEAYEKDKGAKGVRVANVTRFCGGKTSISRSGKPGAFTFRRANGEEGPRSPSYGQWISRNVDMGFNPMPKRAFVNADGMTLKLREIDRDVESAPYDKAKGNMSADAKALKEFTEEIIEQPDGDFVEDEEI